MFESFGRYASNRAFGGVMYARTVHPVPAWDALCGVYDWQSPLIRSNPVKDEEHAVYYVSKDAIISQVLVESLPIMESITTDELLHRP
jgi:hypothetical protein